MRTPDKEAAPAGDRGGSDKQLAGRIVVPDSTGADIDPDLVLDHVCRERRCVNRAHLSRCPSPPRTPAPIRRQPAETPGPDDLSPRAVA